MPWGHGGTTFGGRQPSRRRGGADELDRDEILARYGVTVVASLKSAAAQIVISATLAEAWDSGASGWDTPTREAFANDQDDPRALIAVTASTNLSKSDRDPAGW